MHEDKAISLSTLNQMIGEATRQAFPSDIWIVAEILEMQVNRSGHCYLELIEKSDRLNSIIAKMRATIWSFKFRMIRSYFETTSGTAFSPGIKVMLKAEVAFHEVYGLSLNVKDIDPSYTMGDLAMKKQQVIRKLQEAGVMEMNREIEILDLPKRLAIISSETAAGYGDFLKTIENNQYGFRFKLTLFPALMQGENAEGSIISALEEIYKLEKNFDLVILIRGGGSQADLNCFNGFDLAMNIAQFPLPVITGIGHDRDETVADMVAHRSIKTPTAVAEFIIDIMLDHLSYLQDLGEQLKHLVKQNIHLEMIWLSQKQQSLLLHTGSLLQDQKRTLINLNKDLQQITTLIKTREEAALRNAGGRLLYLARIYKDRRQGELSAYKEALLKSTSYQISNKTKQLSSYEKSLELVKPENVLARGYSINYVNNRIIKSVLDVKKNDILQTRLKDGVLSSEIIEISQTKSKKAK